MGLPGPCSGPFRTWPSAGTHRPGQRGQLLEQRGNRHQPPVDGVHGEPERLQGDDAEQRVRARIAERRRWWVAIPEEAAQQILLYLEKEGFIGANGT